MQRPGKGKTSTPLSVVVPTYEEAVNLRPLCTRLFKACRDAAIEPELLFVDDDSGKGTEESITIVDGLKKEGYNVRIRVRKSSEGKGLSSAVIVGIRESKHPNILVMDADLQHEPESVPDVAKPVIDGEAEFAVGSRHVTGGGAENFPLKRQLISWGATLLAKPLTTCTDPMSGFFCIRRTVFQRAESTLNPMGYKIGLELMVRCRCNPVRDVPITFRDREAGESKLTMKQNFLYLAHLARLYLFLYPKTVFVLFMLLVSLVAVMSHFIYSLTLGEGV